MQKHQYAKLCAVALTSAGLLWAFKAGAIILTTDQPALALELGLVLFPVGILGLYFMIDRLGTLEKIGLTLAVLGFIGSILAILYPLLPDAQTSSGEEFVLPYSLFVLAGSASGFLSLIFLGLAFFHVRTDLGHWRITPLIVALLPFPLAMTSIIHLEIPILLIGLLWMVLAYFLVRVSKH